MSQQKAWFTGIRQIKGPQLNKLACANIWVDELDGDLNCRDHISKWHPQLEFHKKRTFSQHRNCFPCLVFFHLVENIFPSRWEKQPFFFIHMLAVSFLMTAPSLISCCQTCAVKARGCVFVFPRTCTAQFQWCHFYKAWCNPSQEQCKTKARCLWSTEASLPCCGTYVQRGKRKKIRFLVVPLKLIWVFPKRSKNKHDSKDFGKCIIYFFFFSYLQMFSFSMLLHV